MLPTKLRKFAAVKDNDSICDRLFSDRIFYVKKQYQKKRGDRLAQRAIAR
ncbi:hypothetical protein QUB41_01030 [Microcoleus sp. AT8-B2]